MKKLSVLLAVGLIVAAGCHRKKTADKIPVAADTVAVDGPDTSWRIIADVFPDTVYIANDLTVDSLKDVIRSRDSALFEARFKLARVWYYDSLCLKNSRLDKYLKGWIRRALEK